MKSLMNFPVISTFIKNLDTDTKKYNFPESIKRLVDRSKSKLIIKGIQRSEEILKHKPVVVVANHPNETGVFSIIASLPSRDDAYLVVNRRFTGIVSGLDKYLIPVYVDHHFNPNKILGSIFNKFHPKSVLTPDEEHTKNIQSVAQAAQRVSEGALVTIFPASRSVDGSWYTGIGHLLKQVKHKQDVYIVRTFVQGTSIADYLRIIPGAGRFLNTITVHIAEPLKLSEVWDADPKLVTRNVENKFNEWVRTLS